MAKKGVGGGVRAGYKAPEDVKNFLEKGPVLEAIGANGGKVKEFRAFKITAGGTRSQLGRLTLDNGKVYFVKQTSNHDEVNHQIAADTHIRQILGEAAKDAPFSYAIYQSTSFSPNNGILVFENIDGFMLYGAFDRRKKDGFPPTYDPPHIMPDKKAAAMAKIGAALSYLHVKGMANKGQLDSFYQSGGDLTGKAILVHEDFQASNVMFTPAGKVYFVDSDGVKVNGNEAYKNIIEALEFADNDPLMQKAVLEGYLSNYDPAYQNTVLASLVNHVSSKIKLKESALPVPPVNASALLNINFGASAVTSKENQNPNLPVTSIKEMKAQEKQAKEAAKQQEREEKARKEAQEKQAKEAAKQQEREEKARKEAQEKQAKEAEKLQKELTKSRVDGAETLTEIVKKHEKEQKKEEKVLLKSVTTSMRKAKKEAEEILEKEKKEKKKQEKEAKKSSKLVDLPKADVKEYTGFKHGNKERYEEILRDDGTHTEPQPLLQGPLPKNKYTYQVEGLVKAFLNKEKVSISWENDPKEMMVRIGNEKPFNLTVAMKYANFNHINLSPEDCAKYVAFLKDKGPKGSRIKPETRGGDFPTEKFFLDQENQQKKKTKGGLSSELDYAEKCAINIYTKQDNLKGGKAYYAVMNEFLRGNTDYLRDNYPSAGALTHECGEILSHLAMCIAGTNKLPDEPLPETAWREVPEMPEVITKENVAAAQTGGITNVMQMISTNRDKPKDFGLVAGGNYIMYKNLKGVDVSPYSKFNGGAEREILMPPTQVIVTHHAKYAVGKGEAHFFVAQPVTTYQNLADEALEMPQTTLPADAPPIPKPVASVPPPVVIAPQSDKEKAKAAPVESRPPVIDADIFDLGPIKHILADANAKHLSKPYTERGIYMQDFELYTKRGQLINRPNHNIVHTIRKVSYAPFLLNALKQYGKVNPNPYSTMTAQDLRKIQAALIYSVTGRKSDASMADNEGKYKEYKKISAQNFRDFFEPDGKGIFSPSEIEAYAVMVESIGNPNPTEPQPIENYKHLYTLLNLSHDMDLRRCKIPPEYTKTFMAPLKALIGDDHANEFKKHAEQALQATGNKVVGGTYNEDLFYQCSTNLDFCIQQINQINSPVTRLAGIAQTDHKQAKATEPAHQTKPQGVEHDAAKMKAAQDAARVKAEQDAARVKAEQDAARVKAAQDAARVKAEQDAARVKSEQEAARVKEAQEAKVETQKDTRKSVQKPSDWQAGVPPRTRSQPQIDKRPSTIQLNVPAKQPDPPQPAKNDIPPASVAQSSGLPELALDNKIQFNHLLNRFGNKHDDIVKQLKVGYQVEKLKVKGKGLLHKFGSPKQDIILKREKQINEIAETIEMLQKNNNLNSHEKAMLMCGALQVVIDNITRTEANSPYRSGLHSFCKKLEEELKQSKIGLQTSLSEAKILYNIYKSAPKGSKEAKYREAIQNGNRQQLKN